MAIAIGGFWILTISVKIAVQKHVATLAVGFTALALVSMSSAPAQAACAEDYELSDIRLPSSCLTPTDKAIVKMRLFRSGMAVAALSCNQQAQYNSLVTRHEDELVKGGKALRAMFRRMHKGKATQEMNRFVTHLANYASIKSMAANGYCTIMSRVFSQALELPANSLSSFVENRPIKMALNTPALPKLTAVASAE